MTNAGASFPKIAAWRLAGRRAVKGASLKVAALDAFSVIERDAVRDQPRQDSRIANLWYLFNNFDLREPPSRGRLGMPEVPYDRS